MDFVYGDPIRFLPCMHIYHLDCIDDWLMRSFTCPSCMEPVDAALLSSYETNWLLPDFPISHTHSPWVPLSHFPFVHEDKLWNGVPVALWDRGPKRPHWSLTSPVLSCWTGKPAGAVLHPYDFIMGFLHKWHPDEPVTHHSTLATLTLEGDKPSRNILENKRHVFNIQSIFLSFLVGFS